jgi:hypothetical protein
MFRVVLDWRDLEVRVRASGPGIARAVGGSVVAHGVGEVGLALEIGIRVNPTPASEI